MTPRTLIITPVHNEARHIERVARAMARQTAAPAVWLVVDDASTDESLAILRELEAEIPFLTVLTRAPASLGGADRLAAGAEVRAFNWGLQHVEDLSDFAFIGKIDGDVELPADYFERILERFEDDPRLGLAGGRLVERHGDRWEKIRIPPEHVHGALKLYRAECLQAIGGMPATLGWDSVDQIRARMIGFGARSFPEIVAIHHRPWGSAQGVLRGRARHGTCAWIGQQPPAWVLLRAVKLASTPPYLLSGAAFLWGYVRAAARRTARVDDPGFRVFVRRELRGRLLSAALGQRRKNGLVPRVGRMAEAPGTGRDR